MNNPAPHQNAEAVKAHLAEVNPQALLIGGMDFGLVGWGFAYGVQSEGPVAVYERELCILGMMHRDGSSREDAEEYFDFNVAQAYVGSGTPIIIELVSLEE